MDNQHIDERYELYCKMLDELDEGCRLIIDYDSVPHTMDLPLFIRPNLRSFIWLDTAQESLPTKLPQSSKKLPVPALS